MKKYLLLFLLFTSGLSLFAQENSFVNYERDNGWNIGFNMGATWQPREGIMGSTDFTKPYAGFGGGMTLGKSIYEKQGAFFAVDLRGRYLGSYNAGWSGSPEYSYELTGDTTGSSFGFRNYRLNLHEFSLEGVLTLNRLRERTGIILYGFGGIGATLNKVDADYRDFTGDHYNYGSGLGGSFNSVDTSMNAQAIAAQVQDISDHDFETPLSSARFSLVPSWGVGFGYQIGPSFSMGVEYKLAYDLLGDEFDGGSANMLEDNVMDKYHYASAFFRWNILTGGGRYTVTDTNDGWTNTTTNTTTNITQPAVQNKPLVNIYNPSTNNKVVHSNTYTIKAKIYHVENVSGVSFTQNGLNNSSFTFNPSTNEFIAQVYLQPGSNVFEITGTNTYGSDKDSRTIILEQEFTQLPPPVVDFTNPSQAYTQVGQAQYTVVANVLNVAGKNDIKFWLNGQLLNNFTYNTASQVLTAVVTLNQGSNSIKIKGTNSVGSDEESVTINYVKPQAIQPPVVTITVPSSNPYATQSPVEYIEAQVINVDSKNNIQVLVNGSTISNFNFSSVTKKVTFSTNLIIGANVIQITGTNTAGVDIATTNIIYKPSEVVQPPIVEFIVPNASPFTSMTSNITLKATVLNVSSSSNIKVTMNGSPLNGFSFNSITKEVSFNANLIIGNNVFVVTGTNTAGTDNDNQTIVYKKPTMLLPPVVNITNPNTNPYNTNIDNQVINAEILNVSSISGVSAKLNGANITGFTFDPNSKKFAYNANLVAGANILEITGTNTVGTASKSQTIIYTEPIVECDNPTIALTNIATPRTIGSSNSNPAVNMTTSNSKGSILAVISNATNVDFKINGQSSPGYNYNPANGKFESLLHLEEGANTYQLIATNDCGTTIQSITYIYTPEEIPCEKPVINLITPRTNPYSYTGPANYSFSFSVLGATGTSEVSATFNGKATKSFFDNNANTLSFGSRLNEGTNTIVVTATNDCGTTTQTVTVNYTKPIAPPTVTITAPGQNPLSTFDGNQTVKATVTGVDNKNQVQVLVDGQSTSNFTLTSSNSLVTVPLTLALGSHEIIVKATNTAGSAQDETEIDVNEECEDPVIALTQPQGMTNGNINFETSNSKGAILANISHASSIVFKVNGVISQAYNYNPATGAFECLLHLKNGTTSYELTATNSCGTSATSSVNITYTPATVPCTKPTVSFVSPSTSPYTSSKDKGVVVSANVTGVSAAADIACTINGQTANHSFNAASNTVTLSNLTLVEGNNTVVITATNPCGATSASTVLVFDKPTPAPQVDITSPSSAPHNSTSTSNILKATVLNVSGQSAVEVLVDGQSISNFTYNYTSKQLNATLTLAEGQHTIIVKGTNSAGTAQDQTMINVQLPKVMPDVNFTNVSGTTSRNPHQLPSCGSFIVTGVVTNAAVNDITFIVDGLTVSNATTNVLTNNTVNFSIPISFVTSGQVINVKVTATNADGSDSQMEYIKCNQAIEEEDEDDGTTTSPGVNPPTGGTVNTGGTEGGNGNGNGNNGHGNNEDGVDSSNPGQGSGGPNGQEDESGDVDDESGNGGGSATGTNNTGGNGNSNSGNNGKGDNGNNGGNRNVIDTQDLEYQENIEKGDNYFNNKQYDEAYNYYYKALQIKPSESHPKNRILAIEEIKNQQELDATYNDKIKKADLYFNAGKLSTAKAFYKQALGIKPNASYPIQQIAKIDEELNKPVTKPTITKPTKPVITKPTNTTKPTKPTKTTTPTNSGTKTTSPNKTTKETGTKTVTPTKTVPTKTTTPVGRSPH